MRIEDEKGHTRGSEGHDPGKPAVTAHPHVKHDADHPGYETQDVNVGGVLYFLGGLMVCVVMFFFLCFFLGKAINSGYAKSDGDPDRWHQYGNTRATSREDLTPNPVQQQKELAAVTQQFPTPRLVDDDDNQETSDMHAREDLLLDYYSSNVESAGTTTRIPIDRAMQLVAQRGLGAAAASAPKTLMAGETAVKVQAPLTNGFARTGYELDQIQTRKQKNVYAQAVKGKE